MFGQFLHIVVSCLKLDRNIFKDPKYFGEAAVYFAGLIMMLDGVAGAVAAIAVALVRWSSRRLTLPTAVDGPVPVSLWQS